MEAYIKDKDEDEDVRVEHRAKKKVCRDEAMNALVESGALIQSEKPSRRKSNGHKRHCTSKYDDWN